MNALYLRRSGLPFALLLAVAACGDDATPPSSADTSTDTGESDAGDASFDADVTPDTTADVVTDAVADSSVDAAPDVAEDTVDTGADTAADVTLDVPPAEVAVRGAVTETDAPVWLGLTVDGAPTEELLVTEAGDYVFNTVVTEGAAYEVSVLATPDEWYCQAAEATAAGTVGAEDVMVDVPCVEGQRFRTEALWIERETSEMFSVDEVEPDVFSLFSVYIEWGDDGTPQTDDDDGNGYLSLYSRDGRWLRVVQTPGTPGPDGVFLTDDDPVSAYQTATYNAFGDQIRSESVDAPGEDETWSTEDDVVRTSSAYLVWTYDDEDRPVCRGQLTFGDDRTPETDDDEFRNGLVWTYFDHPTIAGQANTFSDVQDIGPDGLPCTSDDTLTAAYLEEITTEDGLTTYTANLSNVAYNSQTNDAEGQLRRNVSWEKTGASIGGPGVDTVTNYRTFFYDPIAGPPNIYYDGPGPDGVWFTDDDDVAQVSAWHGTDDDVFAYRDYQAASDAPMGPDGVWGTDDDDYDTVERRESLGVDVTCTVRLSDGGADGLWQDTACGSDPGDNRIQHIDWTRHDAEGRPVSACRSNDEGPDGLWLTADDEARPGSECGVYSYFDGDIVVFDDFLDAGADGLMFTSDDFFGERAIRRLNAHGHVVLEASADAFDMPGADGVWLTGDDPYDTYDTFEVDRAGRELMEQTFHAGPDGVLFNEDDVLMFRERHEVVALPDAVYRAWD